MAPVTQIQMVLDRIYAEQGRMAAALDKLRDTQSQHGSYLKILLQGQGTNYARLETLLLMKTPSEPHQCPSPSAKTKPTSFLDNIASTAAIKWLVALLIALHLSRGGDALTLLQALLKAS